MYLDVKNKKIFKGVWNDFKEDCVYCLGTFNNIKELQKKICNFCSSIHIIDYTCLHCNTKMIKD